MKKSVINEHIHKYMSMTLSALTKNIIWKMQESIAIIYEMVQEGILTRRVAKTE